MCLGPLCYVYSLNSHFVYLAITGTCPLFMRIKPGLFYLYATTKSEIYICSNKHETCTSFVDLLCFCSVLCLLCLCARLFISAMCFVVTCWERADLLALVCGVYCEFVTFPLVSWVRCGTRLYRFLIFAPLLTSYRP